jgi:DNA polymerase
MLNQMMNTKFTKTLSFGEHSCVSFDKDGIVLPNTLRIRYANLRRQEMDGKTKTVYDSRKGTISTWGGAVVENVVQALARIIVGTQMVEINETYPIALTVHDAAVVIVPEDEVDEAVRYITGVMSKAPSWATGLPVACEAKVGASYGEC